MDEQKKGWKDFTAEDWTNAAFCETCGLPLLSLDPNENGIGEQICIYCTWKEDDANIKPARSNAEVIDRLRLKVEELEAALDVTKTGFNGDITAACLSNPYIMQLNIKRHMTASDQERLVMLFVSDRQMEAINSFDQLTARVSQLEQELTDLEIAKGRDADLAISLAIRVEKFAAALAKYADHRNWNAEDDMTKEYLFCTSEGYGDGWEIAEEALK